MRRRSAAEGGLPSFSSIRAVAIRVVVCLSLASLAYAGYREHWFLTPAIISEGGRRSGEVTTRLHKEPMTDARIRRCEAWVVPKP
jgi:hypothetical protein